MLTAWLICERIAARRFRLSIHAESEREADAITLAEIERAFSGDRLEIIEDYPDDPRGPSCLALGYTGAGGPIHAVMGIAEDLLVVVTIYRPDPDLWEDWRRRKG